MIPLPLAIGAALVGYGLWESRKALNLGFTLGGNPLFPAVTAPTNMAPVNPVTGAVVPAGTPTFQSQVQKNGNAVNYAHALHDLLKTGARPAPMAIVMAFQVAANSDPMAVALHGPLPTSGQYDTHTSAALTMYTGDPIPADENAPKPPPPTFAETIDMSKPGAAALSGSNLYQYLTVHGNDKSSILLSLVKQFQLDVNTDPKFPGPAVTAGMPKFIVAKLQVNGNYDDATAKALAVMSPDAKEIKP